MLSIANAARTRETVRRISSAVVATSLAWSAVVEAEPGIGTRIGPAQGGTASEIPETVPLPHVPRFQLIYPGGKVAGVERELLPPPTLHLDTPYTWIENNAPRGPRHVARHRPRFDWEPSRQPLLLPLWAAGNEPTTSAGLRARPSTPKDERSAWARWNSGLWGVSATMGVAMIATVAALSLVPRDFTGWINPDFYGLRKNFTEGPSFDYDNFFFNYIAHPIDGSEFYLIARNRGLTWWQGFAYAVAVSTTFEFLIESAYEKASWQDLWITPVSGTVIGELRWQAKKALEDPVTGKPTGTVNKILYVVVDPVDALLKL
jgi:Domain of unknown function (DUF3943)